MLQGAHYPVSEAHYPVRLGGALLALLEGHRPASGHSNVSAHSSLRVAHCVPVAHPPQYGIFEPEAVLRQDEKC